MQTSEIISESLYSARVRELFSQLIHAGSVVSANDLLSVTAGSYEQGAQATFSVVRDQCVIQAFRYQAYGCPHFLAACEWLSRWMEGRAWSQLSAWNWRDVERIFEVPANKRARLLLLDDVVSQLKSL